MKAQETSQEEIKGRMLRHISALWEIKNTDALDPVVKLLTEVLAGELHKTQQEILSFQNRILKKTASSFTPPILRAPYCAHGILHAVPVEADHILNTLSAFSLKKRIPENENGLELSFTPTGNFRITNSSVRYLISGKKIFAFDEKRQKSLLQSNLQHKGSEDLIWIGIQLSGKTHTLDQLYFYADFSGEDRQEQLLARLKRAEWRSGNRLLQVQNGLPETVTERKTDLFMMHEPMRMIEKEVNNYYAKYFLTLSGGVPVRPEDKQILPEKTEILSDAASFRLTENLLWISIQPSLPFDENALLNLNISLNAFPVLNRKIIEKSRRLDGLSNIIPVNTESFNYYSSIHLLTDSSGIKYREIPAHNSDRQTSGTYSIRKGGVEKLDPRTAKEYLEHLIILLREEYSAFSALGESSAPLLSQLEKIVVQLEQRMKQANSYHAESSFCVSVDCNVKPDTYLLQYWVTNGRFANDVYQGTKLKPDKGSEIKTDSVYLLKSTSGGKSGTELSASTDAFNYSVLTNNKLITAEDIKAFCYYELGDKIENVQIRKGFETGNEPGEGLRRITEICLTPNKSRENDKDYSWSDLLAETQAKLELRSALNLKLKLVLLNE